MWIRREILFQVHASAFRGPHGIIDKQNRANRLPSGLEADGESSLTLMHKKQNQKEKYG
jgi:hypothetical protein